MEENQKVPDDEKSFEDLIEKIKKSINLSQPVLKRVHKVLNGDIFVIGDDFRVKLLGVKTPKVSFDNGKNEFFSRKSLSYTNSVIQGKKVKLKFDKNKFDGEGNILAYVYLADNKFLNAEIIKLGYGRLDPTYDFIYVKQFGDYEKSAKEKNLGLWRKLKSPKPQKILNSPPNKKQLLKSQFNLLKYVGSRKTKTLHYWYCTESEKIAKDDFMIFKTKKDALDDKYISCKICNPK